MFLDGILHQQRGREVSGTVEKSEQSLWIGERACASVVIPWLGKLCCGCIERGPCLGGHIWENLGSLGVRFVFKWLRKGLMISCVCTHACTHTCRDSKNKKDGMNEVEC